MSALTPPLQAPPTGAPASESEFDVALMDVVPVMICLVVGVVLCVLIACWRWKKRARRAREGAESGRAPPTVSGGVAMNANAYRNQDIARGSANVYATDPRVMPYPDAPPSYEDAIKST